MDGLHFIYFADPMCSWCWGFSPVVETLRRRYGDILPIRLVMGGLRPGTDQPMTEDAKQNLRGHWVEIGELTGQGFGDGPLDKPGFLYDTDPAARAVVLARRTSNDAALGFLARAQAAFYAEGRDVTDFEVLADLASEQGFDRRAFLTALAEEPLKNETWRDYAVSQRAGVTGFPTLILGPKIDGTYALINRGYQAAQDVVGGIDALLATAQPGEA
jgi:putative protein-disulfide isomerase